MKTCEFLNNTALFPNECKSRYFCKHHWYGRNEAGYSFHECNLKGNEFTPEETFEETFVFGIGHTIES